jgi:hypothetical protein
MSDEPKFRIVDDRVITEDQYQSEKSSAAMAETAMKFKFITIPVALVAALTTFFTLDIGGWFWKLLIAWIIGLIVFVWLIPAFFVALFFGVGYLLYLTGAFG